MGADTVGTSEALSTSLHIIPTDFTLTAHTRNAPVPTTAGPETEYTAEQRETIEALEASWALLVEAGYEPC